MAPCVGLPVCHPSTWEIKAGGSDPSHSAYRTSLRPNWATRTFASKIKTTTEISTLLGLCRHCKVECSRSVLLKLKSPGLRACCLQQSWLKQSFQCCYLNSNLSHMLLTVEFPHSGHGNHGVQASRTTKITIQPVVAWQAASCSRQ